MSMGSDNSVNRRVPRQERAEQRVAELLDAAAAELAEVGYDATTMKAIAIRAGASIGAAYQYFPNKEALVSALRERYAIEMEKRWAHREETTVSRSIREGTEGFVDMMVNFLDEHPAWIAILDAPADSRRDRKTRDQLRERLAQVFCARRPAISHEQARLVASIALQMIKSMNALYAAARPQERSAIVLEYKLALTAYLERRLTSYPRKPLRTSAWKEK
jgi:AcrR family transcriptional regulator